MVFPLNSYDEQYMQRYTTWAEARRGHNRAYVYQLLLDRGRLCG